MTITAKSEKEGIIFSREDWEFLIAAMDVAVREHPKLYAGHKRLRLYQKIHELLDKSALRI